MAQPLNDEARERLRARFAPATSRRGPERIALNLSGMQILSAPPSLPPRVYDLNLMNNRLKCLPSNLPSDIEGIMVRSNQLKDLPNSLPSRLGILLAASNRLVTLPNQWPTNLRTLELSGNHLVDISPEAIDALARLPRSCTVDLDFNPLSPETIERFVQLQNSPGYQGPSIIINRIGLSLAASDLESVPDDLPSHLQDLDLRHNPLTTPINNLPRQLRRLFISNTDQSRLPDELPPRLQHLEACDNGFIDISQDSIDMLIRMGPEATVDLRDNPLSTRTLERLEQLQTSPAYRGPRIHLHQHGRFSPWWTEERAAQPALLTGLAAAVSVWRPESPSDIAPTPGQWQEFSAEPNASAFSYFLTRLRTTVSANHPPFRNSVSEWLHHLETNPQLRSETFTLSESATASCRDRIFHAFNDMRQLRLASDVSNGDYDQRLPELLTLARSMFRLGQLETIAREHAAARPGVDEIEVYLGFQVMLRERLALPLDTTHMHYPSLANITPQHLERAYNRVIAAEGKGFADFLANDWRPWQAVLQRQVPIEYEQAQEQLKVAMDKEFSTRLKNRLQKIELENDPDSQRTMGPVVQAEIAREIKGPLTQTFLRSNDLLDHLC